MNKALRRIEELLREKETVTVAVDGRCASGKTTLANEIARVFDCNVIHMDDFFLRREQRTEEREKIPGENIDHERFYEEVIVPLKENKEFSYGKYDCSCGEITETVFVPKKRLYIAEGSYSCHEKLRDFYDLRIFTDVSHDEQLKRIENRNGKDRAEVFIKKWIPLEEMYFEKFNVKNRCDICIIMR